MDPLRSPLFAERLAFLEASEFWSADRHLDYQLRALQRLVEHVERHVPFYRDHMRHAGFTAADIQGLDDLRRFPLIDKPTIQDDYDAFIPDHLDRSRLHHRTTGGSTGTPLTVYADDDFYARDKANTEYYMRVFGLDIFSHRSVRIYGDKVDEAEIRQGRYWYVADGRRLVMSCYHISRETAAAYVEAINDFQPRYIHTRPSSILPLALAVTDLGLELGSGLEAIFCDGEYLTNGQRKTIEQAFKARLTNIFGHTEGAAVGIGCPHSTALHFMPQVGIVEVHGADGTPLSEPGTKGEMVVTGFNNPVFPLIRYRTGDIVQLGKPGCACGRHYTMISDIEGRIQDYVVDRNGNLVPLAPAIFNYNDMDWRGIREFKVVQEQRGQLVMHIQPEADADVTALCRHAEQHLSAIIGEHFTIQVTVVDRLDKTRIGKYRYLDQKLDLAANFRAGAHGPGAG